ncbi:hypothetical protein Hanom_Chr01g00084911 [Helianthus anomalus]
MHPHILAPLRYLYSSDFYNVFLSFRVYKKCKHDVGGSKKSG